MKELQFNKNSWYAWIYKSSYSVRKLPTNICSFFWKLVFALIMFIPCWPLHVINFCVDRKNPDDGTMAIWGWAHIILAMPCYLLWVSDKKAPISNYWYLIGLITLIGIVAILLGFFGISIYLSEKYKDWHSKYIKKDIKVERKPNPLVEGFKSWKNKYCAKINWQ